MSITPDRKQAVVSGVGRPAGRGRPQRLPESLGGPPFGTGAGHRLGPRPEHQVDRRSCRILMVRRGPGRWAPISTVLWFLCCHDA